MSMVKARHPPRILAMASGGGHWVQLMRLQPAFEGCDVIYAVSGNRSAAAVLPEHVHQVPCCNRRQPVAIFRCLIIIILLVIRTRPDVIVTTGAAPGVLAALIGRMCGARVAWIDSIANAEQLSLSGRLAGCISGLWLTQWPHLQRPNGPHHAGGVL